MKRIVLVGGGHAHMTVLARCEEFIKRGHSVLLVSPYPYHYYSGMGPGMLAGYYQPHEARFDIRRMVETGGGRFLQGSVVGIEPEKRTLHLDSGETISYDIVSFNIGSLVPSDMVEGNGLCFTVKPVVNLSVARRHILQWPQDRHLRIVVVGGGPAGVEVAGCSWSLTDSLGLNASVTLVAGGGLMKRFPEKVRRIIRRTFDERGIEILEGTHVLKIRERMIHLSKGTSIEADMVFIATGVRPPEVFRKSGLRTGPDNGLLVNQYLQHVDYPEIFGGGDCIYFGPSPLEKVGVYAVRQNPVLFHNLLAYADGAPLREFKPGGRYLLIFNLGGKKGLYYRGRLVFNGKVAFWIKDYIDRRFIKRFQIEELSTV